MILNALQSFIIALIYHMDLSITTLRLAFKNKCAELLPPNSTQPVCGALFHPQSSPVAPGWGSGACGGGKFSGHLYQTTSSDWVHCLYHCLVKLARSKLQKHAQWLKNLGNAFTADTRQPTMSQCMSSRNQQHQMTSITQWFNTINTLSVITRLKPSYP